MDFEYINSFYYQLILLQLRCVTYQPKYITKKDITHKIKDSSSIKTHAYNTHKV